MTGRAHLLFLNSVKRHVMMTGTLPTLISQLSALSVLQLGDVNLSGTLPSQLAQLTSLIRIGMSSNRLSGEIPLQLKSLTKMQEMYVFFCTMSNCPPQNYPAT